MFSRYLDLLAMVQLGENRVYGPILDAQSIGQLHRLTALLPLMHGVITFTALQFLADALGRPELAGHIAKLILFALFLAISVFLLTNRHYAETLLAKLRSEPTATFRKRKREAITFAIASYVLGFACVFMLIYRTAAHDT